MNHRLLYATAFLTGACVMIIELTASRLLAPFFGASLYVWTNVIGVIMVALAAGYWFGGRLAEATKSGGVLAAIIIAAGMLSAVTPFAVRPLATVTTDSLMLSRAPGSAVIFLGSFLVLILLFSLPILLLGMVSPFVIRLLTISDQAVGKVAGRVFAVSTAGSILGTFLPALFLVPMIGSRKTVLAAAAALVAVGTAGMTGRKRVGGGLAVLLIVSSGALLPAALRAREGLIEERETAYQYLSVQDEPENGRTLRFNEGLGIQSLSSGGVPRDYQYWDSVAPLLGLVGDAEERREILMLGLAGGTVAEIIYQAWGDSVLIRGVEIDPEVVRVGRKYFSLNRVPTLDVVTDDGRMAILSDQKKYDMIYLDAFTNQLYIPPHLATVEFFKLARERLKPGGILALNVIAPTKRSALMRRITATLQAVFPNVYRYDIPSGWNHLFTAAEREIDWTVLPEQVPASVKPYAVGIAEASVRLEKETLPPLTDDSAPVEVLTDVQVFELLKGLRS